MRKNKSQLFSLGTLVIVFFLGWYLVEFFSSCAPEVKVSSIPVKEQYMGTRNCASCHEKEYLEWQGSHHDLSMQEASDSTVLGDFTNVTFESNGLKSKFFKKEGKFFVNTEGSDGEFQNFEVLYTFGVTPLQQYMVALPGGRLQCLLTAWDTVDRKWFDLMPNERLRSDDWLHWTGGSMTWNTMCADCHSTYLEKNYDEESNSFDTEWAIINVSCEACHGPGAQHVDYIESSQYKNEEKILGSFMELTSNLDNKQQIDQCGRCHARRGQLSEVFDHSGEMLDHYLPDILRPGLYHSDGQILDEVYVYGSFLQSRMYRNNVRCTNCHNAHSMELLFDDNLLCTQCHIPDQYDTPKHHFHENGTEGAACISCHMTGKIYMGNDFRRDHSFRVPRPDQSAKYGTPNACSGCHKDKSAEWASEAIVNWYGSERAHHFSDVLVPFQNGDFSVFPELIGMLGDTSVPEIVQATAVWHLGQTPVPEANATIISALAHDNPMIRYAAVNSTGTMNQEERLRYLVPLLSDPVKAVRGQVAYMMADISDRLIGDSHKEAFKKAKSDFMSILKIQADFPSGQLQRGQYYHKQQDFMQAERAYLNALKQDPYLAQAHFNLANLYYQQNDFQKAEEEFIRVISLQDNAADAYYSLGLLQAEMQNLEGAATNLGKAAELSGNPRHYYNWGLTLQNLQKPNDAEKAYKKGISAHPDFEPLKYALAILYIQQNKASEARPIILQLIEINPNNPDYLNLLNAIK